MITQSPIAQILEMDASQWKICNVQGVTLANITRYCNYFVKARLQLQLQVKTCEASCICQS